MKEFIVSITTTVNKAVQADTASQAIDLLKQELISTGQIRETDPISFSVAHDTTFEETEQCYKAID